MRRKGYAAIEASQPSFEVDGDPHEVHRAARPELLPELGAVVGDGLVGDAQDVGNFGHGLAPGEKAQDFQFAWRKVGNAARVGPGAQERDLAGHFWMQVAAALGDPAHRFGEQQGIVVLGDIALRAGLDRPRGEHRVVVHAEDDDARVGLSLENAAAEFEAGQARQIQVDQGDVGLVREIGGVAGVPIRRVKHFDGRIGLEQRPATGRHDRMIVDDENPHLPSSARPETRKASRRRGPTARTPALTPDIDRDEGKINVALFGSGLMWRNIPLRHRLSLMFATLLLLWLAADIGRILMNAGPRVQAEARSVSRLTQEFIETSLAGLRDAPKPEEAARRAGQ